MNTLTCHMERHAAILYGLLRESNGAQVYAEGDTLYIDEQGRESMIIVMD